MKPWTGVPQKGSGKPRPSVFQCNFLGASPEMLMLVENTNKQLLKSLFNNLVCKGEHTSNTANTH